MASTPLTRSVRSATEKRLKNCTGRAMSRSHSPDCIRVSMRPCSRNSPAERESRKPVVANATSSRSSAATSTGVVSPTGTRLPRIVPWRPAGPRTAAGDRAEEDQPEQVAAAALQPEAQQSPYVHRAGWHRPVEDVGGGAQPPAYCAVTLDRAPVDGIDDVVGAGPLRDEDHRIAVRLAEGDHRFEAVPPPGPSRVTARTRTPEARAMARMGSELSSRDQSGGLVMAMPAARPRSSTAANTTSLVGAACQRSAASIWPNVASVPARTARSCCARPASRAAACSDASTARAAYAATRADCIQAIPRCTVAGVDLVGRTHGQAPGLDHVDAEAGAEWRGDGTLLAHTGEAEPGVLGVRTRAEPTVR